MQTISDRTAKGATILLAQTGAGLTDHALQQLREMLAGPAWPELWVLTPNRLLERHLRQGLAAQVDDGSEAFNVSFLQFQGLAGRVTGLAGHFPCVLRGDECQQVLRDLIQELAREDELQVFAQAADMPGMLRAIARWLDELQAQLVSPEAFLAAARSRRDRELAAIAARYRKALRDRGWQDPVGHLALACKLLEDAGVQAELAQVGFLLATGFDCFTPLQAQLLMRLAACVPRALITLPTLPGREAREGARFLQTLELLQEQGPANLRIQCLSDGNPAQKPDLQQLVTRLCSDGKDAMGGVDGLQLLEAAGPAEEARAITRRIKRLVLESDARPEDCLIVLRDWPEYAGPMRAAGREHGVPLAFARGEPLIDQPVIRHLLSLLELSDADFPLQETLDVLRAPCFAVPGLGPQQVTTLERVARQRRIAGGREAWSGALDKSCVEGREEIAMTFRRFMEAVTPPTEQDSTGLWRWLRNLCGLDPEPGAAAFTLAMRACMASSTSAFPTAREQAALDAFDRLLERKARANTNLFGQGGAPADSDAWRVELRAALEGTRLESEGARPGAALVVEASMAPGLSARHVFIPGLSAGIFPHTSGADPLHLATERRALAARGVDLGPANAGGDDALFLQLLGMARDSLLLTRPTEENGNARRASHLWRAVQDVASDKNLEPGGPPGVVPATQVASVGEALIALTSSKGAEAAALRNWLQRHCVGLLERVEYGVRVEAGRLSGHQALDRHAGVLADGRLIAIVADMLGPDRLWSASQLNELGACRYRFFAGRLLDLEELWQPEPGLNALERGSLNHAILEAVYCEVKRRNLTIEEGNLDEALTILECQSQAAFDSPQIVLERDPDALWSWEQRGIRARLEAFVRLDFSVASPLGKRLAGAGRRSLWQERKFGEEEEFGIPLAIDGRQQRLKLRGFIDRMDVAGGQALVVDYKSGSTTIPASHLAEGIELQMLVYLRAAKHLLRLNTEISLTGGTFLQLRSLKSSGVVSLNDRGEQSLQAAQNRIAENIAAARRGDFAVEPRLPASNGHCTRYCEFWQLCRVKETRSPEQGAAP